MLVLTDQRSPLLPHLPTAAEQGLPGIQGNYWLGIFAPAGTPEPIAAKFSFSLEDLYPADFKDGVLPNPIAGTAPANRLP